MILRSLAWLVGLVSIGWFFWQRLKSSDDPAGILYKVVLSLAVVIGEIFLVRLTAGNFGGAFLAAASLGVCGLILSIIWTSQISGFLVSFFNTLAGGNLPPEPKPYYSLVIAKRKGNQPLEAVTAIREHLSKFPDDFESVMLLANIQAVDLEDLPSAEMTLNHFCEWGQAPREQITVALAQLADWQLKFYQNTLAAQAALQRIVDKYPGTDAALAAQKRIAQIRNH
jgi:hypothetical protein